ARELRYRSTRVASLVLAEGVNPLSGLAVAYAGTPKNESQPLESVRDRLMKKLDEDMVTDLARSNVNAVGEYLVRQGPVKAEEVRSFLNATGALSQALALGTALELGYIAPAAHASFSSARDNIDRRRTALEFVLAAAGGSPWLGASLLNQR